MAEKKTKKESTAAAKAKAKRRNVPHGHAYVNASYNKNLTIKK